MNNKKLYSLTLISNILKLISNIFFGIITVPISVEYWKNEKYGIWLLINSILIYLTASNLGLNAASSILMNKERSISKKIEILKKSLKIIIVTALILIVGLVIFNYNVENWILFLGKISFQLLDEAQKACFILMIFFLINIPFSLCSSAFNGFHKVYIENIFLVLSSLLSFLVLLLNIHLSGDLVLFSFLIGVANLFLNSLKFLFFYFFIYQKSKNENNERDEIETTEYSYGTVISLGLRCFSSGIASMIVLNTDNLVISHFLGVENVPAYAITFKLFAITFNLIYIVNSSLIPILGRLISENNLKRLNELYNFTFYLIVYIGGGIYLGSLSFFKPLILSWAGKEGYAGTGALFFLGAYAYIFSVVNLNYIIINTLNYVKYSTWVVWGEALTNIIFSIILSRKFGLVGIAFGTFFGTFLFPTIVFPIIIKRKSLNIVSMNLKYFMKHIVLTMTLLVPAYLNHKYSNVLIPNLVFTMIILLIYSCFTYLIHGKENKNLIKNIVLNKFGRT